MELSSFSTSFFFIFVFASLFCPSRPQQTYINNKQLDCYSNFSFTEGYLCNGPQRSCISYLTFRSQPPYDSPADIAYLLGSQPSLIASINNITDVDKIPTNTQIIVPVNCSCSGSFYQHNSSYTLKYSSDTYFIVANDTYQGLTTCQALMSQNPYESRNLAIGLQLTVPLRCACPSRNQSASGVKFLLSYMVTWGNTISSISKTFGVDEQSLNLANELSSNSIIFPFNPILVPLKTEPTNINLQRETWPPPPVSPEPPSPVIPAKEGGKSKNTRRWIFIGIGIGVCSILIALFGFLVWYLMRRRRSHQLITSRPVFGGKTQPDSAEYAAVPEKKSGCYVSSEGVREFVGSLTLYTFEELQRATEYFSEGNRIKGSVYRGVIKGDNAAIKRMKGDVTNEISILKQINHYNIIRLSGFCVHEGNTYLVHEYAENGSLSDWLHHDDEKKKKKHPISTAGGLGWKQRVQIAYDVSDGLNYLHNYANPPYIHKDLSSSNILLNANLRGKIANFGLARTLLRPPLQPLEEGDGGVVELTRHVVGTQGYLAPEYLENGVVTPKLDVFALGVVMLELLSGREAAAAASSNGNGGVDRQVLLSASIKQVVEGENVRAKLRGFMDPSLAPSTRREYPLDLAFSVAQLAMKCVAEDLNARPTMTDVFMCLSDSFIVVGVGSRRRT